jgi:glyoxylase-like metal-dependent hydrolase (beta-lactamase superfamily II)
MREVAPGVRVHQSQLIQNNSIVVQGRAGVLVVDPGLTDDELTDLAKDIHDSGGIVVAGFSTHPDWDHVLWHPDLGEAPRYATARGAEVMRQLLSSEDWRAQAAEGLPPEIAGDVPLDLFGVLTALPEDATLLPWDGPAVRLIEHRAHAAGHAALLIEDARVLLAGDMLSDVLVPMLDLEAADPIADYLNALALFESVAGEVDVVMPGHGSVGGAGELRARIDLDRAYVRALRDSTEVVDPRIGASARPGWEWVSDVHAWQVRSLDERDLPSTSTPGQ